MRRLPSSLAAAAALTGAGALFYQAAPAAAEDKPYIGPHDIPTLFFINKSDDKNRVDYGIRLDAECAPLSKDAIFPYWRRFEPAAKAPLGELNMLDRMAYGIASQRLMSHTANGSEFYLVLKAIHRELYVHVTKGADGKCTSVVHIAMAGQPRAELLSGYLKLRRPLSVEYLEIRGREGVTGQPLVERVKP